VLILSADPIRRPCARRLRAWSRSRSRKCPGWWRTGRSSRERGWGRGGEAEPPAVGAADREGLPEWQM